MERLRALLPEEGQRLLNEYSDALTTHLVLEADRFIEELIRHLPGVIRGLAEHIDRQAPEDIGACCQPES